jgi:hypothetical protein
MNGNVFSQLAHRDILFPEVSELPILAQGMSRVGIFNNAVLAIDGTHINITKSRIGGWNFYNRHGTFSINFLCVCDFKKRFRSLLITMVGYMMRGFIDYRF